MKRALFLFIPALLTALVYSSCKKGDNGGQLNTVTPGAYRSLDEAINSTAPVARTTALSVSSGGTIIAPGGTNFVFPANAFETLSGGKVTGSVNVTVQDWLFKGDMVFGRVLPIAFFRFDPNNSLEPFEKPLQSGGEAFVQVTQNGQILRVKKSIDVQVQFPQYGAPVAGASGWVGRTMIGSANTVNWVAADSLLRPVYPPDSITFKADTLHYIQAAIPMSIGGYNNFTVKINSPVDLEQSMAVALYDGIKTIFPLPAAVGGRINASGIPSLPSSTGMHIAVMGINKGNFYGGVVAVPAAASDSTYTVIVKAMEPPTLRIQLNGL